MTFNKKLAVIGAGHLGGSLIRGLLNAKQFTPQTIRATVHPSLPAEEIGKQLGVMVSAGNNAAAAQWADIILISVRPFQIQEILAEIKTSLQPKQILISLAAAVPIKTIENAGASSVKIFRAMPNLAMTVEMSATAICANKIADTEDKSLVENIFKTVGRVYRVDESMMHAVTALSGSGPAYVAFFAEALATGAIKLGLPANLAIELTEQMILGSAKLLLDTGKHPSLLRNEISTPGGTTVAGLKELDRGKVSEALQAAVKAAGDRSQELTQEI